MAENMRNALVMSGLKPDDVGYINAHGTSTLLGDQYEAEAVSDVFGTGTAISSLKGHMGHCFAPCGTIEAIVTLDMLKSGSFIPTLNLEAVDPSMPRLDYLKSSVMLDTRTAMSNNFAMGGMNVSLILGV
jgi:3-oxoacyl-[acyl-carrier-protein] synthase II